MELIRTPKVENVKMLDRFSNLSGNANKSNAGYLGTLYLTATHLIFVDQEGKRETWILHSHLASIEKLSISTAGTPMHIRCKNFRSVTFVIPKERDAHDLYTSLYQISQPLNIDDLYCFQYTASNEEFQSTKWKGWNKFNLLHEYERIGLPNNEWIISKINENYAVCDTYPRHLVVPANASDQMLRASTSICRCSQPLSGFKARCVEDEALLNCILSTNKMSDILYVVDTRPKINAMANKAAGKGYESEVFYENIKFYFLGIENIHVMRGSLQKLLDACELKVLSINAFLSALEGSNWLKHIKSVLETAVFIAQALIDGITVIVHCSDGWDRTAQTCSIAELLLDPYYRTIDGFEALIEKEWLAFGHKFTDRCGHIQTGDSKEVAPVFTQFIDCTWQIMQQFPFSFEFNEKFLLILHDHVYSCQFGTFIGNCDKERNDLMLKTRSYSLWAYFESQRSEFINPFYATREKSIIDAEGFLNFNCSSPCIRFWRSLYNRFDTGVHPRESITDLTVVTYNHIRSLEEHITYLEQVIIVKECMERLQQQHDYNVAEKMRESEKEKHEEKIDDDIRASNGLSVEDENTCESPTSNDEISNLIQSMETVALYWQSFRDAKECHCSFVFDHSARRYHCWACGDIYCVRCMEKQIVLPGHSQINCEKSENIDVGGDILQKSLKSEIHSTHQADSVPVCNYCYKMISQGLSPVSA
ncbi:Myotubularin-related protein 8-like protein [Dinothrombium tinctorium]|uniref:phosphatidylinositol-3,5-bisphosphate 3-phosphatase n=1 Tax=Dinothrombium tinctorium TaxID=1965070 RepID=A0A3S3QFU6_9ACAR|nr:Myotubularin-related protein 8-like protein [Dinothrombium tinctorium]RWS08277.1 Myotubularin-related protein 8-like protein [Dinothrombium tinctorium]RWS11997.1 Myotubularin-related protein 8-like protein [Dinothrombium tinctorium]